ncbi:disulfide bond formation protein DsbB [Neisseria sp. HSC-16F19]|nr:disulfide bond formation protein B [Neisseria sp. HSC-16F19]MCP2040106.1 disulfide bond formation protein DsbB [Neisseria sp. HSC-16F19]
MLINYRQTLIVVLLLSLAATGGSFYAQYVMGLNPCVMCIQQRLAVIFTAVLALVCLLLPLARGWGRTVAALLVSAAPVWGLSVAIRQLWLQSLPLEQQPSCGAPWTFRLRDAPLFDWYEPVIRGTGQCGVVDKVFGLALPWWTILLMGAVLLLVWGMWWRNRRV